MKTKFVKQLLTATLAATLAFTSVVPAYAAENTDLLQENLNDEEDLNRDEEGDASSATQETQQTTEGADENNQGDGENNENTDTPVNNEGNDGQQNDADQTTPSNENTDDQTQPADPENTEDPEQTDADQNNEDENNTGAADETATPAVINVAYELNGGVLNEEDADKTAFEGVVGQEMTITLNAASTMEEGVDFLGWYTTADFTDEDFTNEEDIWTYTFTPEAEEVNLTFYAQFGTEEKLLGIQNDERFTIKIVSDSDKGRGFFPFSEYWSSTNYEERETIEPVFSVYGDPEVYNTNVSYSTQPMPTYPSWDYNPINCNTEEVYSNVYAYFIPEAGYVLEGVYLDEDFRTPYTSGFGITAAMIDETDAPTLTLYPQWVPADIRVTVYENITDKFYQLDTPIHEGSVIPALTTPVRAGYEFTGWTWYTEGKSVPVYPGSDVFTAKAWESSYGQAYNYGYNYQKGHYYVDIEATWAPKSYNFVFHLNQSGSDLKSTKTYKGTQSRTTLDPNTGDLSNNQSFNVKGFKGWKVGNKTFTASQTVGDVMLYADEQGLTTIDLYALWDGVTDSTYTYILKSSPNEGAETITRIATTGQVISFTGKEFSQTGYDLAGWTYTAGGTEKIIKITDKPKNLAAPGETVTLIANWKTRQYTVNYYVSDDKGAAKVTANYVITDNAIVLDINNKDLAGKAIFADQGTLIGWTTATDKKFDKTDKMLDLIKYADEKGITTVDLYAQWSDEGRTYNVVFDTGLTTLDGEVITGQFGSTLKHTEKVAKGETVILSGKEYVREGYTLTGWTYDKTVSGKTTKASIKPTGSFKDLVAPGATASITLTADWQLTKYKITYNLNGGTTTSKDVKTTVEYNKNDLKDKTALLNYKKNGTGFELAPVAERVVTKTGYEFLGWKANGESYVYYAGNIYKNLTLVAEWGPVTYNLTFDGKGGTDADGQAAPSISVKYGESVSLKNHVFTYNGYKFKDWKDVKTGKTYKSTASVKNLSSDGTAVKLEAEWTPVNYTVKYNYDGGKLAKGDKNPAKYTVAGIDLKIPVKTGYYFKGYTVTQTGDVTTAAVDETVDATTAVVTSKIRSGSYGNVTLTANWATKTYEIQFKDGTTVTPIDAYKNKTVVDVINFRAAAIALDADKADKSIIGFANSEENQAKNKVAYKLDTDYSVSKLVGDGTQATVTVYPVWGKKTYHITYMLEEGMSVSKKFYVYSQNETKEQTLPTAVLKGYKFVKWTEVNGSGALNEAGTAIVKNYNKDITLKPVMEAITYEVKYSPNAKDVVLVSDGKTAVANKAVSFGKVDYKDGKTSDNKGIADLPTASTWRRTGYTFIGFGASSKATEPLTSLAGLTTKGSVTVYAIWKPDTYTVSYYHDYSDSTPYKEVTFTYDKKLDPGKETMTGHVFKGWWLKNIDPKNLPAGMDVTVDKNGYVKTINAKNAHNIELVPRFESYKYKININGNGGMIYTTRKSTSFTAYYDENVESYLKSIARYNMSRKGYTFRCLAYDKAGKKPVVDAAGNTYLDSYVNLSTKNNGTVTMHAVWDKVDPVKPANVTATLENRSLRVNTNETASTGNSYEVQYSTNMFFLNGVQSVKIPYSGTEISAPASGSKYYVRVRRIQKDSTGAEVAGKWSGTIRASKTASN